MKSDPWQLSCLPLNFSPISFPLREQGGQILDSCLKIHGAGGGIKVVNHIEEERMSYEERPLVLEKYLLEYYYGGWVLACSHLHGEQKEDTMGLGQCF